MKTFQFERSYEEIEIAGKVYKIDFADDKVLEYQKAFVSFQKGAQELQAMDVESLTPEDQITVFKRNLHNMKEITEVLLGEGTFEELYEQSGRSTTNYMQLLLFLGEVVAEKTEKVKDDARKKYVKKERA